MGSPFFHFSACLSSELNRQTVSFTVLGNEYPSRKSIRKVQQWKGIPEFLAWKIAHSSQLGPITIPRTEDKVTLVVTAYVHPPNRISYPKKSPEVDILNPLYGGPAIETYPLLYVAPIEPPGSLGWDTGTAVWTHILHNLQAAAQNTPTEVNPRHFHLIVAIAWANPDLSRMLYYNVDPKQDGDRPIEYVLLNRQQKQEFTTGGWVHMRKVIPDAKSKNRMRNNVGPSGT